MGIPASLTPLEVFDLAIHSERMALRMYRVLARRVEIETLSARLVQLQSDEKDHCKTFSAHRKAMFGSAQVSMTEEEAAVIFGSVDVEQAQDKETLIQVLYAMIRFEEYAAYFYDRQRLKIPNREARIWFEVASSECKFHADILKRQIDSLRPMEIELSGRGRLAGATS